MLPKSGRVEIAYWYCTICGRRHSIDMDRIAKDRKYLEDPEPEERKGHSYDECRAMAQQNIDFVMGL